MRPFNARQSNSVLLISLLPYASPSTAFQLCRFFSLRFFFPLRLPEIHVFWILEGNVTTVKTERFSDVCDDEVPQPKLAAPCLVAMAMPYEVKVNKTTKELSFSKSLKSLFLH